MVNEEWTLYSRPTCTSDAQLSTNGIRFSKIPAGIYTTKGISGKAVVEWIKSEMELYENDRMEEVRNKALTYAKMMEM